MPRVWIATNVTFSPLNIPILGKVLGPRESVDVTEPIPAEVSILTGRPRLLELRPKGEHPPKTVPAPVLSQHESFRQPKGTPKQDPK